MLEDIKTTATGDAYMDRISKLGTAKLGLPYAKCNEVILYKNWVMVPLKS